MEATIERLLLIGTVAAIALHFPELIAWSRILRGTGNPDISAAVRVRGLLRKLLRIEFFFAIVLLAYSLSNPVPSGFLVYPLVIFHLAGLIVGERDLPAELSGRRGLYRFIRFLLFADALEIVLLSAIALQLHGVLSP